MSNILKGKELNEALRELELKIAAIRCDVSRHNKQVDLDMIKDGHILVTKEGLEYLIDPEDY